MTRLLTAFFLALCLHAVAADRPNILFLLSDDHSYPFLSSYCDSNVKTPTLDQLAAEGMKFHCFFTTAPQCVPSRASFLTGRSPVAARITRFSSPLARDEITSPRPVYELYDLEVDPSELNNLSGKPELVAVERELRVALAEKMILDFDYLPLPAMIEAGAGAGGAGRTAADAENWFNQRDTNNDGFISREEFPPRSPWPKQP